MKNRRLFIAFAVTAITSASAIAQADEYLLGPQDHLRVKVYDYRPATGEAHEWTALVGEFVVNPSGNVSFPIVGEIPASGQSTSRLAQALATRLQDKVGLAQAPLASVEVKQFRPFYVIGTVDKPGEYDFRPGLTVLQAVGIAGGSPRLQEMSLIGLQRDALSARGDLNSLLAEQSRLKIRLARLDAQVANADTYTPEPREGDGESVEKAREEERLVFQTARDTRIAQRAVLEKTKEFLRKEIVTLNAKGETIDRQLALGQRELASVDGLVAKGLVVAARQISLEQNRAQLESSRLDIQLGVSRAQQDMLRADRDFADVTDKARSQTLVDLSETRTRLDALAVKIVTAQGLANQSEIGAAIMIGGQLRAKPRYSIARADRSGKMLNLRVEEGDLVQPGDTVRVEHETPSITGQLGNAALSIAGKE